MSEESTVLQEKIDRARTVGGVPVQESLVPYRNIGELLAAQADAYEDKAFLVYYSEDGHRTEISYREFFEEVCKTANYLQACGIARGDRVATVSHNHSDAVIHYFAAFALGAAVVPVNVGEDDKRVAFVLEDSGAKLAFVQSEFVDRIQKLRKPSGPLERIVETGPHAHADLAHFPDALRKHHARFAPAHPPALQDDALIVYTSGTTGHPKGVVLSHYNLLVDAMSIGEWHRISEDQKMMCVLPIHHVNGIVVTLMTPLYAGGGIVLNQKFNTDRFFERISIEKVTVVSVVPTLLQFLLHAKLNMEAYKLAHFRHFICGAGPLTVDLAQRFESTFKMAVIHGYGLSETTCYSCFLPIDLSMAEHRHWMAKNGLPSIGVPLPINEMAIHDENGNEREEGEKGEIVIRGHNVMCGYYRNGEANETSFAHGWFRSGDEGFFRFDDQGRKFFFITGRIKELIIRGGVNISPFEVDEVLMHIPGIEAGFAVGFENDWYGEEVGAFVKLKPEIVMSEEQVLANCRKHLPFSKAPKVVVFGNDIPVTSTGKYQRNKCKDLFSPWKAVQFTEQK
ncbi:MAG TPA: class I adenylate-forming enzyme family protein [Bacteroidota bacterium]|nr:class I adenylate-forming enzyme family protein [Bacteroidota bacterium]